MHFAHHVTACISLCALAWSLGAPSVQAEDEHCQKLKGTFAAAPVLECADSPVGVCTKGVLEGDLRGEYFFAFDSIDMTMSESGMRTFTAHSVITTAEGVLRTADTGTLASGMMMDATEYMATGPVTEATGVFAGARATFVATGGLSASGTKGTYEVVMCRPAPRRCE